jgi:FMN phosphatase YigB (HAD superfamily)
MTTIRTKNIISFDVFDTCLVRSTAFPSDVFQQIALDLRGSLEPLLGSEFVEHFSAARINAEARAFRTTSLEEVTLDEIWHQLAEMIPGIDETEGKQAELALERKILRANGEILMAVNEARKKGFKVVFTSDTYLPGDFIKENLQSHGLSRDGDSFYISSELGLTKRSGNLFNHLLAHEQVPPSLITHVGDNPRSDKEVPQRLGISTKQIVSTQLSSPERSLLSGEAIDPLTVSKLSGAMRAFRLRVPRSEQSAVAQDFVSEFLGPFMLTFAAWTLSQAKADRCARLYFLSRDCYLLSRVAAVLTKSFGGVDCRYLQVSRQALCLPSVVELSFAGMPWITRAWEKPSLDRLLAKLEIDVSQIDGNLLRLASAEGGDRTLQSTEDWNRFWAGINEEPIRTKLRNTIAHRRRAATAYFVLQGLMDEGVPWAVVDLGWWLTCQKALSDVLRIQDPHCCVRGYYLGLQSGRNSPAESGHARGLFYGLAPDKVGQVSSPEVFERVTVLEHVLGCAPHGTVRRYEFENDQPNPQCEELPDRSKAVFAELEILCLEFCRDNMDLAENLSRPQIARHVIDKLLTSCFANPKPGWVHFLRPIEVSMDQNNIGAVPLARPYTSSELIASFLPSGLRNLLFPNPPITHWPEADLAIAPSLIAQCANKRNGVLRVLKGVWSAGRLVRSCVRSGFRTFASKTYSALPCPKQ